MSPVILVTSILIFVTIRHPRKPFFTILFAFRPIYRDVYPSCRAMRATNTPFFRSLYDKIA